MITLWITEGSAGWFLMSREPDGKIECVGWIGFGAQHGTAHGERG
jgi:hypothetical protein